MNPPAGRAIAFALHGGAGVIDPGSFAATRRAACAAALRAIASRAVQALRDGAPSLDVVEQAVAELEDCEFFNAGRGAVLNGDGVAELDAAIMDGRDRAAGAVCAARRVRNPVRAARALLRDGAHVLLAGEGADRFAAAQGLPLVDPEWFVIADRRAQLDAARAEGRVTLDHDERWADARRVSGTVGAVALDRHGHLAAATSTGGMTNKAPGRVGDSPLVGAGTFADDDTCAVSATGHGEFYMRRVLAHDVHARMLYLDQDLHAATEEALAEVGRMGGTGGLVAVDHAGQVTLPFNSPGMYRAWLDRDGAVQVAIYRDPEPAPD
ncbi:MAG: isoaspartyl peptidase/L-asparaginase [Xanthomonadaceae bacterium]|jgi:isoaspartyl peptidase/L-asparaginase-like protein (Ntn-hydrolase superfamily)|nr:isoaspartyl peptidase/L-asparaginase [Xanthomonadaceae bacterium]